MESQGGGFRAWLSDKIREGVTPDQWNHIKFGFYVLFTRRSRRRELIPLGRLRAIHLLEHASAREKMKSRASVLAEARDRILAHGSLDFELQQRLVSSPSPMMAVPAEEGLFYVFNGNSRLHALNEAFPGEERLPVEIEIYEPPKRALPWLQRIRHSYDPRQPVRH